jgi:hypothetical protein
VNKALHRFTIDAHTNSMSGNPYSMYWTAYTLGEDDGTTYTFAPPSGGLTANVLMVAGGAGGGGNMGGGGGAGGLVYTTGTSLAQGVTKTIIVGNGSSGGVQTGIILNGNDTFFIMGENKISKQKKTGVR